MAFEGFPRRVRYFPVPSPLLGPLLEEIDDLSELKLTFRLIWLLHQKKGFPRYVTRAELLADRTLVRALANDSVDPGLEIQRALDLGLGRGTLLRGVRKLGAREEHLYMLNTDADRRALSQLQVSQPPMDVAPDADAWVFGA